LIVNEKILLIDDDPAVRRMLSRVLAEENFVVVAASDGWDYLGLPNQTHFDLALLDLSVDPAEGLAVFEGLGSRHPLLPVIIMTEQAGRLISKSVPRGTMIIEKPLDLAKLLQIIRSLLPQPVELGLKPTQPNDCSAPAELAETTGGKDGR
jgi:DNA-binding NtrC family response regulator